MDCCYSNDCEQFSTTPILFTPCTPVKFCESTPVCIPCVPTCNQQQIIYCCEKPQQSLPRLKKVYNDSHCDDCDPCHLQSTQKPRSQHKRCFDSHSQEYCPTCHQPTDTPVKTKYIMPCYRYEDGRIINQPNSFTKHACEVACSLRPNQKVVSKPLFCHPCE
ncbi:unnamed protein product [Parnassius mnemosyne]|uniref:Uncharacterized protein n=1 Tax=Parnassius mnemosyne TaxID=213953 RepID=A0AAV1M8E9_9NEOP